MKKYATKGKKIVRKPKNAAPAEVPVNEDVYIESDIAPTCSVTISTPTVSITPTCSVTIPTPTVPITSSVPVDLANKH